MLDEHNARLREAFRRGDGVEINTEGDSFFVAFPDAHRAVIACVEAQLAMLADGDRGDAELRVRMGLHTGYAEPIDGDYVALAVNQAARVSSAAHGGQVLVSEATAAAAGESEECSFERVGLFRLKGFEQPEPLFQVLHPKLPAIFPAPRASVVLRTNLPRLAARLVGRDETLAKLGATIRRDRVITLVGPGGVGKSTLAVHAADAVAGTYPGGAWLVELGAVTEPSLVPEATAAALGIVGAGGGPPTRALEHRLAGDATLLVLDGAEPVAPAVAELLGYLLPRCPGLTALVASRVPLGLADERVFDIAPLSVPARGATADIDAVLSSPSVQLLRERWQHAAGDDLPELDPDDAALVAAICRRVDGLPLALELVGAALASSTPSEVLDGLESAATGGDDETIAAPLRASLAWSYQLLSDEEAMCFRCLGAFDGEPTLEAAAAVCGAEESGGLVAERVVHLSDRSLLKLRRVHGRIRIRLLDTVRAFAREQLEESGEWEPVADRHFEWYLTTAGQQVEAATQPSTTRSRVLEGLAPEVDDLRRAVARGAAMREGNDVLALGRVAGAACRRMVRTAEGKLCLEAALAASAPGSAERARALIELASLHVDLDDPRAYALAAEAYEEAVRTSSPVGEGLALAMLATAGRHYGSATEAAEWGRKALLIADELDVDEVTAAVHRAAGLLAEARGDYQAQRDHNAKLVEVVRRTGDGAAIAAAALSLATAVQRVGTLGEAEALTIEALEVSTVAERGHIHGHLLAMRAFMAFERGALDEAWTRAQEALEVARENGITWVTAYALNQVGEVALARGDLSAAVDAYSKSLAMASQAERKMYCLDGLAAIAATVGDTVTAVMAHSVLERLSIEESFRLPDDYQRPGEARLLAARDELGRAAFDVEWAAGRAMASSEALAAIPRRVADAVARSRAVPGLGDPGDGTERT